MVPGNALGTWKSTRHLETHSTPGNPLGTGKSTRHPEIYSVPESTQYPEPLDTRDPLGTRDPFGTQKSTGYPEIHWVPGNPLSTQKCTRSLYTDLCTPISGCVVKLVASHWSLATSEMPSRLSDWSMLWSLWHPPFASDWWMLSMACLWHGMPHLFLYANGIVPSCLCDSLWC